MIAVRLGSGPLSSGRSRLVRRIGDGLLVRYGLAYGPGTDTAIGSRTVNDEP